MTQYGPATDRRVSPEVCDELLADLGEQAGSPVVDEEPYGEAMLFRFANAQRLLKHLNTIDADITVQQFLTNRPHLEANPNDLRGLLEELRDLATKEWNRWTQAGQFVLVVD